MLEYAVAVYGEYGRRPEQLVLYTGEAAMRMPAALKEFGFEFRIVDIRDIDPEPLLASDSLAENVITIPMWRRDPQAGVRRLLERIVSASPEERGEALTEVFVLAGLRKLAPLVEEEAAKMPILNDIMDHEVLGPKLRAARAEGERTGEKRGEEKGERKVLIRLLEKRFGRLPVWAADRLDGMSTEQMENASLRVLDAASLEEIFTRL